MSWNSYALIAAEKRGLEKLFAAAVAGQERPPADEIVGPRSIYRYEEHYQFALRNAEYLRSRPILW